MKSVSIFPRLSALTVAALLAACGPSPSDDAKPGKQDVAAPADVAPVAGNKESGESIVAVINGQPITKAVFQAYLGERLGKAAAPRGNQEALVLLHEFINLELASQDAVAQGLDTRPVEAQLALSRRKLLSNIALKSYLAAHPVTDEDLQRDYETFLANNDFTEFRARHILVETEDAANAIVAELDSGADFATLARQRSTDPSSGEGGDLHWFGAHQMLGPIVQALRDLEPGSYGRTPVQTHFGWHVVQLEETRQGKPPSFDELKAQLAKAAQQLRVKQYLESLREDAKIEVETSELSLGPPS
jgi:peptidyl-prolyl cis-trans isomerase C